jgi:dynein light intermediate chain 1, cytosolic
MSEGRAPSPEPQDLWSSILDSVASKRSLPSKNILLLGEPRVGKSTIAAALLHKQPTDNPDNLDFAIGYDWADVRDDADEGMCSLTASRQLTRRRHACSVVRLLSSIVRVRSSIPNPQLPSTSASHLQYRRYDYT